MALTRLPFALAIAGVVLAVGGLFTGVLGLFDSDSVHRATGVVVFVAGVVLLLGTSGWALRQLVRGRDQVSAVAVVLVASIPLVLVAVFFLQSLVLS